MDSDIVENLDNIGEESITEEGVEDIKNHIRSMEEKISNLTKLIKEARIILNRSDNASKKEVRELIGKMSEVVDYGSSNEF